MTSLMALLGGAAATMVVKTMPLSNVTLTGDWAVREQANREVLMGLNLTQWACHFTTAANLTHCQASMKPWHTYVKNASGQGFEQEDGFLAAGSDVKPAATQIFSDCEAFCATNTSCLGFTFQADSAHPKVPIKCYWKHEIHFTPQHSNCIASGGIEKPQCEPLPGEMGLGGYYGHYQGHWLSATAFLINSTGNATVRDRANAAMSTLRDVMDAWTAKYGGDWGDGYLFPYDIVVWQKLLSGHGAGPYYSVPFYTLHKLLAGLLDQYTHASSSLAYKLAVRIGNWVHRRVETTLAAGGMALWQKVLLTEWGGMNDALFHLYELSGDAVHLATARRFNGYVFTARLAVGQDDLADLPFPHANFHLPEVIGNARGYELTGNTTDRAIVRNFFAALTANHSYCTGGSNSGECWQAPRDLGNFLTTQTEESCTQYNVLKVARHLFLWDAAPTAANFYERAILNGIVGNQRRESSISSCGTPAGCTSDACCGGRGAAPGVTSYIYMLPLGGAVKKAWGKSNYGFPCCWGTLSESFAKLGDSIYFVSASGLSDAIYVNLFVSSVVKVGLSLGEVTIEQRADAYLSHPSHTSSLTIRTGRAGHKVEFSLKIRVPSWLMRQGRITVNGAPTAGASPVAGTFYAIERAWEDGDVVSVDFPPSLWTAPLNDYHAWHNATLAFMFGPLVLAGVNMSTDIFVPAGQSFRTDPSSFITRKERAGVNEIRFEARGTIGGVQTTIEMVPLRDVRDEQFVVYFMTAGSKPPQPAVRYCPHSAANAGAASDGTEVADHEHGNDEVGLIVSSAPPSGPAAPDGAPSGRGVEWQVDAESGQMWPLQHSVV